MRLSKNSVSVELISESLSADEQVLKFYVPDNDFLNPEGHFKIGTYTFKIKEKVDVKNFAEQLLDYHVRTRNSINAFNALSKSAG